MKPLLFNKEISKAIIDESVKLKESTRSEEAIAQIIDKARKTVGTEGVVIVEDNSIDWPSLTP